MDNGSPNFFRSKTYDETDFAFEDSCSMKKRDFAEVLREFNILEPPASFLKHLSSEKDPDFITSNAARYPAVDSSWRFDPPTWSYFAKGDAEDDMSLLNEDSCSSTAVMGDEATNYSFLNSTKLGESLRKHGTELCMKGARKNRCAEACYKDSDELYRGNNLDESGMSRRRPNPSASRSLHHPNEISRVQKSFESHPWLFGEENTSIDIDSCLGFSQQTSELDLEGSEHRFWSDDQFDAFPVSDAYPETSPSCKKFRLDPSVKSPSCHLFSEEVECPQSLSPMHLYEPAIFTNVRSQSRTPSQSSTPNIRSRTRTPNIRSQTRTPNIRSQTRTATIVSESRTPDISQASKAERKFSCSSHASDSHGVSGKENCTGGEDKSESRPNDHGSFCNDIAKEGSVENNDLLTESGKTVDCPGCRDTCIKSTGTEDDVSKELIEKQITRDSSEHAELRASKEVPGTLEICINDDK